MTTPPRRSEIDPARIVWSADPASIEGRPLVVLLHGYGSDARDLMNVVRYLPQEYAYASLLALEPCGSAPLGYEWFPLHFSPQGDFLDMTTPELLADFATSASEAGAAVLRWLDDLAPKPSKVALLGFSQGGIVALGALRRDPGRFAGTAIVASLAAPPAPGEEGAAADEALRALKPKVWWGRGTADPVIPARGVAYTEAWMAEHADATIHVEPGLGHEFSLAELEGISAFLRDRLGEADSAA